MIVTRQGMYRAASGSTMYDAATVSTPQTTTFIVPSGIYEITAELRGGGGHGGNINTRAGGGGGGGAYAKVRIPVTPFEVLDLTIGNEGGVTKIARGATVLVQCDGGSAGNPNGGTVAGGTYSYHASVTLVAGANGGSGVGAADSCNPQPGGEGGGGGGCGWCGVCSANGGSGGQFGRGGDAGTYNCSGTPGASGTDSPGYPGGYSGGYAVGGNGAPGLMRITW